MSHRSRICFAYLAAVLAVALVAAGCGDSASTPTGPRDGGLTLMEEDTGGELRDRGRPRSGDPDPSVTDVLAEINRALAAEGRNLAVVKAEFLTPRGADFQGGRTLFAANRYKKLESQWVPGDERRQADGNRLTYMVVGTMGTANPGIPAADTEAAIDRALDTWNRNRCAGVEMVKRPYTGADPTVVDAILGMGSMGDPFLADIVNAGFMPPAFFERLVEGGSTFILGVTFTMIFLDAGEPTDMDGNQAYDVGVKEIYYNDNFVWTLSGEGGIDLETVALHENGHALGLAHFGDIFLTEANQRVHVAPRAVMNAAYFGPERRLRGTDNAAHCGIYAHWPKD